MTTFKSISGTPTIVTYPNESKDGLYVHTAKRHAVQNPHDAQTGTQPAFRMARHRHAILHPKYVSIGAIFGVIGMFAAYGLGVMILISNTRHPVKTEPLPVSALAATVPAAPVAPVTPVAVAPVPIPGAPVESPAAVPTVTSPVRIPIAKPSQAKSAHRSARVVESQKLLLQVKAFNAGFESSDSFRQSLTEKAARLGDTKAGAEATQYLMLIDNTIINARKQAQETPVVTTPPADQPVVQFGMRSLDTP